MAEHMDASERADALMRAAPTGGRRRRSFLASTRQDREPIAELPSLQAEDDDLPVLTEVIVEEEAPGAVPPAPDRFDEALLSIVASDLVRSLEQQLAAELPTLIEASLLNAQNELRDGINSTLDMALRDFLARRQQLSLPLDDADHDR